MTAPGNDVLPDLPPLWDDEAPIDDASGEVDARPEVRLGNDIAANVAALDDALGRHSPVLFQRAGSLVGVTGSKGLVGAAEGTPVVRDMTAPALQLEISRRLRTVRYVPPDKMAIKLAQAANRSEPGGQWVTTVPSERLAIAPMLHAREWRHVRPLRAVVESPVLRPDGSVLQTPGYDVASGYLYRPACAFPPIDESPTKADAESALRALSDLFCDFPHVSLAHRMVPIAALLTILGRAAIAGPTPAFVFDATVRGSGKTLQGDVVHAIAVGRPAPHAALSAQEEEREKVLSGYALSAARVVFIDNVKGLLGGPKLEATLTSEVVGFRVLGKPDIVDLPWQAVMLVSGNNLALTDDMVRRTLVSRLESPLEDPTTRTKFEHDLPADAFTKRPQLLALGLTILRSYFAHGLPETAAGSLGAPFTAWSRVVASAVAFAGGPDVCSCRPGRDSAAMDDIEALRSLLDGWTLLDPQLGGLTSAQIARLLRPRERDSAPDALDSMREALDQLAPSGRAGGLDVRKLTFSFRRLRGRWIAGKRLASLDGKSPRWIVEYQNGLSQ